MSNLDQTIASLRRRFDSLCEDFANEVSALFLELDEAREAVEGLRSEGEAQASRLRQLESRTAGQNELIETLRQEAEEARELREQTRERDLSIERMAAEIESKREIITALRQRLAELEPLKSTVKQRDEKILEQQHELGRTARQLAALRAEIEEDSQSTTTIDEAELATLKAELDARKALIKSLRADAERVGALEQQLESKREALVSLEGSINRHVETIAELKQSVATWKRKYQAAKGELLDPLATSTEPPTLTDTEVDAIQELERANDQPDRTVAIDMRGALKEARRKRARAET